MEKISCAVVASFFGPYKGNFIPSLNAFADEFKARGHRSILIIPDEMKEYAWVKEVSPSFQKVYLVTYYQSLCKTLREFRKIFREEGINLIYTHMSGWDYAARFAAPKLPVIWHMHMNVNISTPFNRFKRRVRYRLLGFGKTYHIAVSQPSTDALNKINPRHKCICIPNAIDLTRLSCANAPWNGKQNAKVLLFGWSPIVKGLDTALDACKMLRDDGIEVTLKVVSQKNTYSYFERSGQTIPEWVELLPTSDDVGQIYSNADIMLSASRSEGFSYALAESIYMGMPVVFSDIQGCQWANRFKATYKFAVADALSLKQALECAMKNGIDESMQRYNQALLESEYSFDRWRIRAADVIEQFISESL